MFRTTMTDFDSLCLTIAFLWAGAILAFVMKRFGYSLSADTSMAMILCCFTALAIRHNVTWPEPEIGGIAAANEIPVSTRFVVQDGDGNYHTPDCERLIGKQTRPYLPMSDGDHAPCVDCILPDLHRHAEAVAHQPPPE